VVIGFSYYSKSAEQDARCRPCVVHLNIPVKEPNGRAGGTPTSLWPGAPRIRRSPNSL